jgi:hypothetical protein
MCPGRTDLQRHLFTDTHLGAELMHLGARKALNLRCCCCDVPEKSDYSIRVVPLEGERPELRIGVTANGYAEITVCQIPPYWGVPSVRSFYKCHHY